MQLTMNMIKCMKLAQRKTISSIINTHITRNYFQMGFFTKQLVFYTTSINDSLFHEKIRFLSWIPTALCSSSASLNISNEILSLADSIVNKNSANRDSNKKDDIINILNFLVSLGYSISDIKEKCLDYLKSTQCSYAKTQQIAELDSDVLKLMPLMSLSLSSLRQVVKQSREDKREIKDFLNRISYLSHHLETPLEDLIPTLTKHSYLLCMKFSKLHQKMVVLKDAPIAPRDLAKDLWIFNYTEKLLADRISAAEKAGVHLKPWMLRCNTNFFISMLKRYSETQRILNGDDVFSYLSKRLDCSKEYVEHMMERNKLLKSINIPKIDKIITFLFEKGYTPQEIRLYPRVFCSRIETLDQRIEHYRQIRSTLPSIPQLCGPVNRSRNKSKTTQNQGY